MLDAWQRTGRVVTVGVQSMADAVWVRAFDFVRQGGIGHVAHAQGGVFRNDARGQWRFYRLAREMTPKTVASFAMRRAIVPICIPGELLTSTM